MSKLDPAAGADRWAANLSGATAQITAGVNAVTRAPGQAAAANVQVWLARVQASAQKWQTNVGKVTLPEWQRAMTEKGIPRIAQGAQANKDKVLAFNQKFYPHLQAGMAKVNNMPKVTLQDNVQRAVAMIMHNASFKG